MPNHVPENILGEWNRTPWDCASIAAEQLARIVRESNGLRISQQNPARRSDERKSCGRAPGENFYRTYMGGSALGLYYLLRGNEEKVRYALNTQHTYSCLDTVNMCQFVFGPAWQLYSMGQLAEAVRLITGWEVDVDELQQVGERRLNLLRAFNAREGIGREADVLPKKLHKALIGGKSDGYIVTEEEIEQAKDWYYAMSGWDVATGIPTREKLEELGLDWVADDLRL